MGYKLGVYYYNEEKKLLVFKWYEIDEYISKPAEEFAQFFSPYVKDMDLTAVIDDGKMDKFSYYEKGKEIIKPMFELPIGDLDGRTDKLVSMALDATMETLHYSSCDHSFGIISNVCDILKRKGKISEEYKTYFERLNSNEVYFVDRSKLSDEEHDKILEIMEKYPNQRDEFVEKAMQEQEPKEDIPYINSRNKKLNNK